MWKCPLGFTQGYQPLWLRLVVASTSFHLNAGMWILYTLRSRHVGSLFSKGILSSKLLMPTVQSNSTKNGSLCEKFQVTCLKTCSSLLYDPLQRSQGPAIVPHIETFQSWILIFSSFTLRSLLYNALARGFPTEHMYAFVFCLMRATCPVFSYLF